MVKITSRHQPFRLVMQLVSPVVITDFAPSLDGVLYAVLQAHMPNHPHDERLAAMDRMLTRHEAGIYHASAMRLGVSAAYENGKDHSRGVTVARYVRSDSMAGRKLQSEFYAPFGKRTPYPLIQTAGGPYKNRLTEREAYAAPFAVFEGMGDGCRILSLLEHYLLGVGYDADNASAGAVGSVELVSLNADESLVLPDGTANRCLPLDLADALGASGTPTNNRLIPPYYAGERVPVVSPDRIRIITNRAAMTA